MTPGFALSLSIEGIVLLARAAGGWRVAGRVPLTAPDLSVELAGLRDRAVQLSDPAFRTKLIIPNDQIRYLSVDTGHVATADRIERVRTALDGATPYAVEDLVYDICVDGPMTHVAAVARDTLEEAESFAIEHRFNPVSFVAAPEDAAFLGEPFFGPTHFSEKALAPGERVEADGVSVVVIGDLEDAADIQLGKTSTVQTRPEPAAAEPQTTIPEPVAFAHRARTEPPKQAPPPDPEPSPTAEPALAPMPGFSSRRRKAPRDPEDAPAAATIAPHIEAEAPDPTPPVQADIAAPVAPHPEPELGAAPVPQPAAPAPAAPDPEALAASLAAPEPAEPEPPAPPEDEPQDTWASRFLRKRVAELDAPVADPPLSRPAARTTLLPDPLAVEPKLGMASATGGGEDQAALDERARLTIFGMRDQGQVGGAPKHLGLILTVVLLVFLAGVAAWASVFLDERISSLFSREPDADLVEEVAPDPEPEEAPTVVTALPVEPRDPAPGQPGESDVVAALAPVEPALTETDAAVLDALRVDPELEPEPEDLSLLEPQETETRYAVTGIWVAAPTSPSEPGIIVLDDLYLTSIDAALDTRDAIALPAARSFVTDPPLGQIALPIRPDERSAYDASGRLIPTPDGALSPEGFTVVLGAPPVVPPPTPDRAVPEAEAEVDAAEVGPDLPDTRPRQRPEDLIEQTERSQLGGLTLSELSGLRPRLRPELDKTEEEADETPTAQAIAASVTPRLRPADMEARVAAAQRTAEPAQETQVAAASTAAIAPTAQTRTVAPATTSPRIPSSASVARAATLNNAINLRRVNLIGVYGTASNRRALVRLPNGRYRKVEVGDRLDGGRISAIGESELRYQKGGRNVVLRIPSG